MSVSNLHSWPAMYPAKQQPGHPAKKYHTRGWHARNENLHMFDPPLSLSLLNLLTAPQHGGITSSHECEAMITPSQQAYLNMLAEDQGITPIDISSTRVDRPLLLDAIQHLAPAWKKVGQVPTNKVPDWFNSQVCFSLQFCLYMRSNTELSISSAMIIIPTDRLHLKQSICHGSDIWGTPRST